MLLTQRVGLILSSPLPPRPGAPFWKDATEEHPQTVTDPDRLEVRTTSYSWWQDLRPSASAHSRSSAGAPKLPSGDHRSPDSCIYLQHFYLQQSKEELCFRSYKVSHLHFNTKMMEDHLPKIPMMVSSSPTDSSGSGRTDDSRGGKEFQQEGQQVNIKAANMGHKMCNLHFLDF